MTDRNVESELSIVEVLRLEDFLLLGTVLLLPWAFGGTEIWAYRTAALCLVAAAAVALWRRGFDGLGLGRGAAWLLPAFLLAVWAGLQLVPLPPQVIRVVSPTADRLYRATFFGYDSAAPPSIVTAIEDGALERVPEASGQPEPWGVEVPFALEPGGRWTGWRPISLSPSAGLERLHWYTALLLGFLLCRRRCRDPEVARFYRGTIFVMFTALAVFGLVYAATSNGKLYWIRSTLEPTRPFGPYVNPTNFAGAMELAVPWMLGYTLYGLIRRQWAATQGARAPVFAAGFVLCLMAGYAAASKSAAVLLSASVVLLALLAARGWAVRLGVLAGSVAMAAVGFVVVRHTLLGERVREFLDTTAGSLGEVARVQGWRHALDMYREFAVAGSGFGSFRDVFPRYLAAGEMQRWTQAHNDYLEVLVEGGAIAGLLVLWLAAGFWVRLMRRAPNGRHGGVHLEYAGMVVGLALLTVHAAYDFNHQIPANALLFVIVAAMAVARVETRRSRREAES